MPALVSHSTHPHTHTMQGRGQQPGRPFAHLGAFPFCRLFPYPTPQGEEEDDRLDGIEQSTHVSFIGREYMNILKLVGN